MCWLTYGLVPSAEQTTKSFVWYVKWWNHIQEDADMVHAATTAWRSASDALRHLHGRERWKLVTGPTSSIVAQLWEWGWVPAQPNLWIRPPEEAGIIGAGQTNDALLLQDVAHEAQKQAWKRASAHADSP